ncbi:hypothetical protein [Plastoroseomonas arctica]|uniref:Uncharacterized protein n=1 Tax=Plastoroseomonas arctica TaxID=1509237 RepID=A0AAF1JYU7_9PROT|nr:hypothetical protein [Plastoroseomonas arctica]MBR0657007.1 hypothetical protein [Plastoroseomonas arctica]
MPVTTTFTVDRVTDTQLRDAAFVRGKFDEATRAVADRDRELTTLNTQVATLATRNTQLEASTKTQTAELQQVRESLASALSRNQALSDRITALETTTPKIAVESLVTRFKADVDKINREVRANPGLAGMLVDSVEVEIKGGLDVSDGVAITQLPAGALTAGNASTLRFNLRPGPVLRIVDEENDTRR